jgi:hypothetical protein
LVYNDHGLPFAGVSQGEQPFVLSHHLEAWIQNCLTCTNEDILSVKINKWTWITKRLGGCADLMECSGVTPQSGTFVGNWLVITEEKFRMECSIKKCDLTYWHSLQMRRPFLSPFMRGAFVQNSLMSAVGSFFFLGSESLSESMSMTLTSLYMPFESVGWTKVILYSFNSKYKVSNYIPMSDFFVLLTVCFFFFDLKGTSESSSLWESSPTSEAGWEAGRLFPNAGTGASGGPSRFSGLWVIGKLTEVFSDGPESVEWIVPAWVERAVLRAVATLSRWEESAGTAALLSAVSLAVGALVRAGRVVAIWK